MAAASAATASAAPALDVFFMYKDARLHLAVSPDSDAEAIRSALQRQLGAKRPVGFYARGAGGREVYFALEALAEMPARFAGETLWLVVENHGAALPTTPARAAVVPQRAADEAASRALWACDALGSLSQRLLLRTLQAAGVRGQLSRSGLRAAVEKIAPPLAEDGSLAANSRRAALDVVTHLFDTLVPHESVQAGELQGAGVVISVVSLCAALTPITLTGAKQALAVHFMAADTDRDGSVDVDELSGLVTRLQALIDALLLGSGEEFRFGAARRSQADIRESARLWMGRASEGVDGGRATLQELLRAYDERDPTAPECLRFIIALEEQQSRRARSVASAAARAPPAFALSQSVRKQLRVLLAPLRAADDARLADALVWIASRRQPVQASAVPGFAARLGLQAPLEASVLAVLHRILDALESDDGAQASVLEWQFAVSWAHGASLGDAVVACERVAAASRQGFTSSTVATLLSVVWRVTASLQSMAGADPPLMLRAGDSLLRHATQLASLWCGFRAISAEQLTALALQNPSVLPDMWIDAVAPDSVAATVHSPRPLAQVQLQLALSAPLAELPSATPVLSLSPAEVEPLLVLKRALRGFTPRDVVELVQRPFGSQPLSRPAFDALLSRLVDLDKIAGEASQRLRGLWSSVFELLCEDEDDEIDAADVANALLPACDLDLDDLNLTLLLATANAHSSEAKLGGESLVSEDAWGRTVSAAVSTLMAASAVVAASSNEKARQSNALLGLSYAHALVQDAGPRPTVSRCADVLRRRPELAPWAGLARCGW